MPLVGEELFWEPNSWGIRADVIQIRWPTYTTINNNFYNDVVRDREAPWRAEFQEFWQIMQTMQQGPIRNHMDNLVHNDDGIWVRPIRHQRPAFINRPPVYENLNDDAESCIRPVCNRIYEFSNRKPVYEENICYNEKVELPSEIQYVQPQPLCPTTIPVEEYPS